MSDNITESPKTEKIATRPFAQTKANKSSSSKPKKSNNKIINSPAKGQKFHGAYLKTKNGRPTQAAINAYTAKTGVKPNVVLWFDTFGHPHLKKTLSACRLLARNKITPFIKLEPHKKKIDASWLQKFAQVIKACKVPTMLSFGHEMNGNWYPWSGIFNGKGKDQNNNGVPDGPENYITKHRYIVDKVRQYGVKNMIIVFNINGETLPNIWWNRPSHYWPGGKYVDVIGINKYNTEDYGAPWRSLKSWIGPLIRKISAYGKPIFIAETSCDANTSYDQWVRKPRWIKRNIGWIARHNLLSGFIWFNESKREDGQMKNYGLDRVSALAFKSAMQTHAFAFGRNVSWIPMPASATKRPIRKPSPVSLIAGKASVNPPRNRVTPKGQGIKYINVKKGNLPKLKSLEFSFRISYEARTSFNKAKYRITIPGTNISLTKTTKANAEIKILLSRQQVLRALKHNRGRIAIRAEILKTGDWYCGIFFKKFLPKFLPKK
jgi:hypothetical protein